eukprot:gene10279-biopygen5539
MLTGPPYPLAASGGLPADGAAWLSGRVLLRRRSENGTCVFAFVFVFVLCLFSCQSATSRQRCWRPAGGPLAARMGNLAARWRWKFGGSLAARRDFGGPGGPGGPRWRPRLPSGGLRGGPGVLWRPALAARGGPWRPWRPWRPPGGPVDIDRVGVYHGPMSTSLIGLLPVERLRAHVGEGEEGGAGVEAAPPRRVLRRPPRRAGGARVRDRVVRRRVGAGPFMWRQSLIGSGAGAKQPSVREHAPRDGERGAVGARRVRGRRLRRPRLARGDVVRDGDEPPRRPIAAAAAGPRGRERAAGEEALHAVARRALRRGVGRVAGAVPSSACLGDTPRDTSMGRGASRWT